MKKSIIIIYGPTGIGKSEYALALGKQFRVELINADVGQLYTPLSLGTAKPDWKHEPMPHHLFDLIDEPVDYSVAAYRKTVLDLCQNMWERGVTPLLVGGSGFYLKSLFFPCKEGNELEQKNDDFQKELYVQDLSAEDAWHIVASYDAARAAQIHKNDLYRIHRALELIKKTGSAYDLQPTYQDLKVPVLFICLTRDRKDLYNRINQRTQQMIDAGWVQEVASLQKTAWVPFLKRKKLIGYDDIMKFLEIKAATEKVPEDLINTIAQKTRNYAKRQMTFWRMLKKQLSAHFNESQHLYEFALTYQKNSQEELNTLVFNFLKQIPDKKG